MRRTSIRMANTGNSAIIMAIKCSGIFALFAVCGAVSAAAFCQRFPDQISFFFPLPFAILISILLVLVFSCSLDRVILAALLTMVAWYASYFAAYYAGLILSSSASPDSVTPCVLGGFVGGVGLVLCASVCVPQLVSVKYLAIGAIVGVCSALTFVPSIAIYELHLKSGGFPPTPIRAFAFWEAMMGTYLFAISTLASVLKADDSLEKGDVDSFRVTPR